MDSFDSILLRLAKDPAMIVWLDNPGKPRRRYQRELGARTARTLLDGGRQLHRGRHQGVRPRLHRLDHRQHRVHDSALDARLRLALRQNSLPLRLPPPEDHDDGEKTFLGHTGNFNGEDIIRIICGQESTARFISRHLYHFFVADEPPVPAWPYTPPRDPEAIEILVRNLLRQRLRHEIRPARAVQLRFLQV